MPNSRCSSSTIKRANFSTAAPLRLALAPQGRRLAVRVIKRRGGDVAQPVVIDVDAFSVALPDSRTSAGRALLGEPRRTSVLFEKLPLKDRR